MDEVAPLVARGRRRRRRTPSVPQTLAVSRLRAHLIRMSQCVLASKVMRLMLLPLSGLWGTTSCRLSIVCSSSSPPPPKVFFICLHLPFLISHKLCACACVAFPLLWMKSLFMEYFISCFCESDKPLERCNDSGRGQLGRHPPVTLRKFQFLY